MTGVPADPLIPDFFLVGAPKAASTLLDNLLRLHPEIFMAETKDAHHLASDIYAAERRPSAGEYRAMFSGRGTERRVGESSVYYLYSGAALEAIQKRCRNPRILILVRNPVELVHSYHRQLVWSEMQPIRDFEEALEKGRGARRELEGDPFSPALLDYAYIGTLSPHIERWRSAFGSDRISVILFDHLVASPEEVLREQLAFLDVDEKVPLDVHGVVGDEEKVNRHKRFLLTGMADFLRHPPAALRPLVRMIVPRRAWRRRIAEGLKRLNVRRSPREDPSPEVRKRLRDAFRSEVHRLQRMLDEDLSNWLNVASEGRGGPSRKSTRS